MTFKKTFFCNGLLLLSLSPDYWGIQLIKHFQRNIRLQITRKKNVILPETYCQMIFGADGVSEVCFVDVLFDNCQDTIKLMLTHTKVWIKLVFKDDNAHNRVLDSPHSSLLWRKMWTHTRSLSSPCTVITGHQCPFYLSIINIRSPTLLTQLECTERTWCSYLQKDIVHQCGCLYCYCYSQGCT